MFDVTLAGVAPHQVGSASGLLESVRQLTMSLGIAVVGTVRFGSLGSGHGAAAFVGAADHALLVAVAFLIAACAAVLRLPKHPAPRPTDPAAVYEGVGAKPHARWRAAMRVGRRQPS